MDGSSRARWPHYDIVWILKLTVTQANSKPNEGDMKAMVNNEESVAGKSAGKERMEVGGPLEGGRCTVL